MPAIVALVVIDIVRKKLTSADELDPLTIIFGRINALGMETQNKPISLSDFL